MNLLQYSTINSSCKHFSMAGSIEKLNATKNVMKKAIFSLKCLVTKKITQKEKIAHVYSITFF